VDHGILSGWPDDAARQHHLHGYRWEIRFRPLLREHWIDPVIYIEFENTSADKVLH